MEITEKKVGKTKLLLHIKIQEADYAESVKKNLMDYRKKINLPGFRVGKVPMGLVKKKYELPIKVEEINKLISNGIQKHISDNKIAIIGGPMPVDKVIDFENNVDYTFEYELGLQPEINLSVAEKAKVDYWIIEPENKQIKEHISNLQKRYGKILNPNDIRDGDMLNVYLEELIDNKPKDGGVSTSTTLLVDKIEDSNLKKKFTKLKKSESIIFSPNKAFSNKADLASMLSVSKEKLDSLEQNFSCQIQNISRLVPAEMNFEFFEKVYPNNSIKTEKAFKSEVKNELSNMYVKESDRKLFNDASLIFMDNIKFDLPIDFLKKWLKNNAKKEFSQSEFDQEYENYLKYLSWQLIENAICQKNDIKITNEKLRDFTKSRVLEQMKTYGSVNMGDKELDGIVSNILKNKQESEKMTNELVAIELTMYFKSNMKVKRNTITLDEFIKLANNQK
tara:strand:+ start:197 stop:1543 length:1347 start_codon:yes stop_codon:yes gene_type:complete